MIFFGLLSISVISSFVNKSIRQPLMCLFNLAFILFLQLYWQITPYLLTHSEFTQEANLFFLLKDYFKVVVDISCSQLQCEWETLLRMDDLILTEKVFQQLAWNGVIQIVFILR